MPGRQIYLPPPGKSSGPPGSVGREAVSDQWYCMASHKPHKHHTVRGRAPKAPSPTAFGKEG